MSNDLRVIAEKIINISRLLHEHTHKLEVAVEGTYANDGSDLRVRLLADTLNMSRRADMELGSLSRALKSVLQTLQSQSSAETSPGSKPVSSAQQVQAHFEREREALNTSINTLK